jgi:hypothetical protein
MADINKTFDRRFGTEGVHQGEYVTRKELREILGELAGDPPQPNSLINENNRAAETLPRTAARPGTRRSIG